MKNLTTSLRRFTVGTSSFLIINAKTKTLVKPTPQWRIVIRNLEIMIKYDTYLGGERFADEEALWIAGNPYWSMNYIGRVTGENFSGDFLKEALLNVPFEKPFRGPKKYKAGNYEYTCSVNGNFDWFQGKEIISFCGKEIYECYFHDGVLK